MPELIVTIDVGRNFLTVSFHRQSLQLSGFISPQTGGATSKRFLPVAIFETKEPELFNTDFLQFKINTANENVPEYYIFDTIFSDLASGAEYTRSLTQQFEFKITPLLDIIITKLVQIVKVFAQSNNIPPKLVQLNFIQLSDQSNDLIYEVFQEQLGQLFQCQFQLLQREAVVCSQILENIYEETTIGYVDLGSVLRFYVYNVYDQKLTQIIEHTSKINLHMAYNCQLRDPLEQLMIQQVFLDNYDKLIDNNANGEPDEKVYVSFFREQIIETGYFSHKGDRHFIEPEKFRYRFFMRKIARIIAQLREFKQLYKCDYIILSGGLLQIPQVSNALNTEFGDMINKQIMLDDQCLYQNSNTNWADIIFQYEELAYKQPKNGTCGAENSTPFEYGDNILDNPSQLANTDSLIHPADIQQIHDGDKAPNILTSSIQQGEEQHEEETLEQDEVNHSKSHKVSKREPEIYQDPLSILHNEETANSSYLSIKRKKQQNQSNSSRVMNTSQLSDVDAAKMEYAATCEFLKVMNDNTDPELRKLNERQTLPGNLAAVKEQMRSKLGTSQLEQRSNYSSYVGGNSSELKYKQNSAINKSHNFDPSQIVEQNVPLFEPDDQHDGLLIPKVVLAQSKRQSQILLNNAPRLEILPQEILNHQISQLDQSHVSELKIVNESLRQQEVTPTEDQVDTFKTGLQSVGIRKTNSPDRRFNNQPTANDILNEESPNMQCRAQLEQFYSQQANQAKFQINQSQNNVPLVINNQKNPQIYGSNTKLIQNSKTHSNCEKREQSDLDSISQNNNISQTEITNLNDFIRSVQYYNPVNHANKFQQLQLSTISKKSNIFASQQVSDQVQINKDYRVALFLQVNGVNQLVPINWNTKKQRRACLQLHERLQGLLRVFFYQYSIPTQPQAGDPYVVYTMQPDFHKLYFSFDDAFRVRGSNKGEIKEIKSIKDEFQVCDVPKAWELFV